MFCRSRVTFTVTRALAVIRFESSSSSTVEIGKYEDILIIVLCFKHQRAAVFVKHDAHVLSLQCDVDGDQSVGGDQV